MHFSPGSLIPFTLLASTAAATHFQVTVGKDNQLRFVPEQIDAVPGDTITYNFFARNHAVVQSSFDKPCEPQAGNAFFSGFTPTPSPDVASRTTFTITVNDTKPIWVYCPQTNGNHCQNGMVQSINAPKQGSNTFDAYKALAAKASTSKSPADGLPVGGERKLTVDVGPNGALVYSSNNITELPRTVVEFLFNPRNHTVTQSSFEKPCQPLDGGFSSGFVATTASPSGASFKIVIADTKPIWFYCGQVNGNHCQSGMVGSINAPVAGNTLDAFIALAKAAPPPSRIPPQAPLGGTLIVNGNVIQKMSGNAVDVDAITKGTPPAATSSAAGKPPGASQTQVVPPPGATIPAAYNGMAGGGKPGNYGWGKELSDVALQYLYIEQFIEDILANLLFSGHDKISTGAWSGIYPKTITDTMGSMAAQALVHRESTADCLQHFNKPLLGECKYNLPLGSADEFLHAALVLNMIDISVLISATAAVATEKDGWLVPLLATEIGAKSRMTAVVNLMQNHMAAAAPREPVLPPALAWSYAQRYVGSCPDPIKGMPAAAYPVLKIASKQESAGRTTSVALQYDGANKGGQQWAAWVGPWGDLAFTPVNGGSAAVPADLYGHVWVVVVSKGEGKLADLPGMVVAGPELVWVSSP
ncbi:hypothetical protein B0H67DRAFT_488705 [Lasiosphaeris hirsuta]|uniref:Extracellular serine-rich protein n=1 Tax=Lasiosphaeris hirsuta TaxID=260670 RepID=A0AA40AG85_9PEZI|nr:hypothetical protein B0H67DRAFT_488705 [Lasiosphaeris hirsuta]